eukprot:TRINITY_DN27197_c0_g1_i1.p1 TRINITY_DN27197_c0_g1~~TRINITY_DN27197_c0_g1_i1.p1  ORF type:complete len:248 (+),score=26.62 TRINITY_DN27197_c0_g1_i1:134-877(+)
MSQSHQFTCWPLPADNLPPQTLDEERLSELLLSPELPSSKVGNHFFQYRLQPAAASLKLASATVTADNATSDQSPVLDHLSDDDNTAKEHVEDASDATYRCCPTQIDDLTDLQPTLHLLPSAEDQEASAATNRRRAQARSPSLKAEPHEALETLSCSPAKRAWTRPGSRRRPRPKASEMTSDQLHRQRYLARRAAKKRRERWLAEEKAIQLKLTASEKRNQQLRQEQLQLAKDIDTLQRLVLTMQSL